MSSQHEQDILKDDEHFLELLVNLQKDKNFSSPNAKINTFSTGRLFVDYVNKLDILFIPYHVISMFVNDPNQSNSDFNQFAENIYRSINQDVNSSTKLKDKALKIRLHILLAEQQKNSLYLKQKNEIEGLTDEIDELSLYTNRIDKLDKKLKKQKKTYNNMLSQYISILGIFAAILMTAFGGIQTFSSIYQNERFSLEESLILACIGFMGVILLIFMLLNSIAKLTGKNIDSQHVNKKWYLRHPTLINSFIILTSIIIIIITKKLVLNPPEVTIFYLLWFIPVLYTGFMFWKFNHK